MDSTGDREAVPGRATPEGTKRFAERFSHLPGHFRCPDRLHVSTIGLGLRRGDPAGIDDLLYRSAVAECLERGVNLFNTALSDRMQTSERALGTALRRAFLEGVAARDEVVVVTKGGTLMPEPERASSYREAQWDLRRSYVDSGLLDPSDVVNGNCIEPAFLCDQIERSRRNLAIETLDVYLIEEPEMHLKRLGPTAFRQKLIEVFAALEDAVSDKRIGCYGLSTWDGLLVPHNERGHLAVLDVFGAALEGASGVDHMQALQLPYGLATGEGAALDSQLGPDGRSTALLEALSGTGTLVMASAPLYGGRVLGRVPDFVAAALPEARSDAQRCLQFARSTANVTTAIVGMREPDHVDENLALAAVPPADPSVPAALFRAAEQASQQPA